MAALSDYLESGLLHHVFRGETFAKPVHLAVALKIGVPVDSDTGVTIQELSSGDGVNLTGYSRISLHAPATSGDDKWSYNTADHSAGSGVIKNGVDFVFEQALQDWGWVSGIALVDTQVHKKGNLLMHAQLDNPRIIYTGDSVKFSTNTLRVSFK